MPRRGVPLFRGFVDEVEVTRIEDGEGFHVRIHHHLGRRRYVIHKHASAFAYVGRHVPVEDRSDGAHVYRPRRRATAHWVGHALVMSDDATPRRLPSRG